MNYGETPVILCLVQLLTSFVELISHIHIIVVHVHMECCNAFAGFVFSDVGTGLWNWNVNNLAVTFPSPTSKVNGMWHMSATGF